MDVLIWIALCKRISLQKSKNLGSALRRSKALKNCREFTKILKWLGSTGPGRSKRRRSCPRHPARILPVGPKGDRVYVNVPGQFGIAIVHRKKRAVVAKWGFGGRFGNYPMALE